MFIQKPIRNLKILIMKKMMKIMVSLMMVFAITMLWSCGGGGEKAKLSEKGELLSSIEWKLDPSATLKGTTDAIEDTTSIIADIKLEGDVKKIADFAAETLTLGIDKSDKSKLSYQKKYGEGLFSISTVGYWNFNEGETAIIMREWDSQAGKEKEPVTWNIVELTKEKLVLQKEGDVSPNIYYPKK
jgi:hypothetical protein